jgi:hypothetical protein
MRYGLLCLALVACGAAGAALPDFIYVDRMLASSTQAVVTVLSLKQVGENDWSTTQEASMRVEASIALRDTRPPDARPKGAGPAPTGTPKKLEKGEQITVTFQAPKPDTYPPPGSPLFFSIKEGERAVVTAASGEVTSYTVSSKELEQALEKEPSRIRLQMGGIALAE